MLNLLTLALEIRLESDKGNFVIKRLEGIFNEISVDEEHISFQP